MFEASLIPTLILILGWGYQPERLQAGTYLIIYIIFSSLPLLFSLLYLNLAQGHLSTLLPSWLTPIKLTLAWWFITIFPFLVKSPIYTVHLWLPKAHVEAPVSGSIILAGILLKLGGYGLFRVVRKFSFIAYKLNLPVTILSLWGGCIASLLCLRQTDIKGLIAYSSISHMGLATAGIITQTLWGWTRALLLIIAHGLISSALFAIANIVYETSHTRNLFLLKGLINLFPSFTLWWFILRARNLGAPPSINMLAETMLITSVISYSFIASALLLLIIIFTTAYCLTLYSSTQYGTLRRYINPWNIINLRHNNIIFFHFTPAIVLFIKAESISQWALYVKKISTKFD